MLVLTEFRFVELPELLTPAVEFELLVAVPPVAVAEALLLLVFALLFAFVFAFELVLVLVVGLVVDGGGRISHSNVRPPSTTIWPSPSPVPCAVTVPFGTWTRIAFGVVQFHANAGEIEAKNRITPNRNFLHI